MCSENFPRNASGRKKIKTHAHACTVLRDGPSKMCAAVNCGKFSPLTKTNKKVAFAFH